MQKIVLGAGCFWGVQEYYRRLKGVGETRVGYTDSEGENPTYQEVCASSGHVEAVEIYFDETVISFEKILEHFFRIIDPTQKNRQGTDVGIQYRTGIYYNTESQREIAIKAILEEQKKYDKIIQVELKPETVFYDAEDYHQEYLVKNPTGYCHVDFSVMKEEEKK